MKTAAYEVHPLWKSLDNLRTAYEQVPTTSDPEQRHKVDTVGSFIAYVDQYRDEDGFLVDENHMNQMNQFIASMSQQLQALASQSPNWGHLDNAASAVPQSMQFLRQNFPVPTTDSATAAAKRASTMYRKSLDAAADQFRTQIKALQDRLANSEQQRQEQEDAFAQELAALKSKSQESDQQINTQAARLLQQIEEQRASFETAANERANLFKEEAKERQGEATEQIDAIRQQAKQAHDEVTDQAEALLERLREHEATSETLVDTTARNAIAGDYGAWARKQEIAAIVWTIAAVVIGLGTAVALIYALNHAYKDTVQFTLYKTGVGIVGLIIAGYCARQAAEHRREERTAKRLHLDLAALEPFLKQVDDPTELRTEIARRVFVPQMEATEAASPRLGLRRGFTLEEIAALVALGKGTTQ